MGYFQMTRNVESIFGAVVTAPHQIPYTYTATGGEKFISLPFYPVTGIVTINGGMQVPLDNFEIDGNTLNLGRALSKGDVVYCLFDKVLSPEGQNSTTRIYKFKSVGGETSFTPDFTSYGVQSLYIDGKYQTPIDDYTYNKETGVVNLTAAIVGAGKWVVAELYVQQNYPALAAPGGADMIGAQLVATGSVYRTQADKNADVVSVKDFGAKGDGLTDCADSIIEAGQSTTGSILIPGGDFVATLTAGNASDIGDLLGRLDIKGSLQLNIAPTTLQFTNPFKFFSGCNRVNGLKVVGSAPVSVSIMGQLGVSGTAGAYAVQLQLSTVAGVSVGDFLHTTGVVGTGIPEVHRGVWEITAVDVPNSRVTVKNTCRTSTFPTNNITSSTSVVLKSILKFNGCDAFVVAGGRIDYLDNVAIVGNSDEYWLSTNVTGTEKGTHGLVIGSQTVAVNGKSDNSNQYGVSLGHVSAGPNVGISGFDQQGIVTELGGSFWGDFVSSCNNKRRGFYASTSAGIRAKHISANGNFLDGVISDIGGNIYSSSVSCAIGNGSRGVSVSHGGTLVFDTGIMSCNVSDGAACVLGGVLQATTARYESNGGCGVFADYGSKAVVNNSVMSGNTRYGLDIGFNAAARANNCTFNNNGLHGIRATEYAFGVITSSTFSGNASGDKTIRGQGMLLDGSSYTVGEVRGTTFRSIVGTAGQGIRMASTSGGDDIIFGHDTTGSGTYTNKWHMRSGNVGFYSETDADTPIGRPANRFSTVYTRNINMTPPASVVPTVNGEVMFQLTSDTQLTIKVKGSDGVVRSANITLS